MIIKKERVERNHIEIDLTGPDGNAFALIGITCNLLRQLKHDKAYIDKVRQDMTSGDYEHLLEVMEREVGNYVVMYR